MRRLRFLLGTAAAGLAGLVLVAWGVWHGWGREALDRWTRSAGFQELISREVSKAMKVDGRFGPIAVEGWEARVPDYTSTGWPGEAIAALEAQDIHAVFNPWAVLRRVWQVDRITIGSGRFALRLPEDALKRPPAAGKKPWFAFFMPTRFYCPEILCPDARVEFPFQGRVGRLADLNLRARMVGRDFEYRADAGRFEFPLLPELEIEGLDVFITREMADIREARLAGLEGDPARARISGRLGMRQDKSVRARVEVAQMPFGQALPEEWGARLEGRMSGILEWNTDASGLKTASDGAVRLEGVVLRGWSWLERLALVHDNPDLATLRVPRAQSAFAFDGTTFRLRGLEADAGELAAFRGEVDHSPRERRTRANLVLDRFDLKRWLPREFKPRVEAQGSGSLFWEGSWQDIAGSRAAGQVFIPSCSYRFRPGFRAALQRYGVELYPDIELDGFDLHFTQAGPRLDVTHIGMASRRGLRLEGFGHWVSGRSWELNARVDGVPASLWRPAGGAGRVEGRVGLEGRWVSSSPRLEEGSGRGRIRIEKARLVEFGFQKTLARFLKDPGFRDLRFRDFELEGEGDRRTLEVRRFRMFTPGKIGLEGAVRITAEGAVSGSVWLGLPARDLAWLPEAETAIFTRRQDGLVWARVRLGGTTRKLEQDLAAQVMRVLRRHPLALAGLGLRAASWWLGDALGTYQEPPLDGR